MSVPSVNFKGRGNGYTSITKKAPQSPKSQQKTQRLVLEFSSSDSDEDELPVIQTSRNTTRQIMFDSSSSGEEEEEQAPKKEQSWVARKAASPAESAKPALKIEDEYSYEYVDNEEHDVPAAEKPAPAPAPTPATKLAPAPAPAPAPAEVIKPAPKSGVFRLLNYQVAWTKSGFKKSRIKMMRNEEVIYYCKYGKLRGFGKSYIISTSENFDISSPSCVGFVTVKGKGSRFTLWTTENGSQPVEALGMAFYDAAESLGPEYQGFAGRAFRIVIPKEKDYKATSKDTSLAMLAMMYEAPPSKFITMISKLPTKTAKGKLVLKFGDVFVLKSIKNFMIEYEGKKVFMCYKSSSGTVTVPIMEPITPLQAFAMTVGIITSSA